MSDSSEEDKFTPAIIEEKKTRPYLLVKLFDKNVDAIKGHSLFEIGDDENDIKCFTQNDLFGTTAIMVKGYVARQFRDCIDKMDDIKTVKICINEKVLAYYDYSIPTLFEIPKTESIKKNKKIKPNEKIKELEKEIILLNKMIEECNNKLKAYEKEPENEKIYDKKRKDILYLLNKGKSSKPETISKYKILLDEKTKKYY